MRRFAIPLSIAGLLCAGATAASAATANTCVFTISMTSGVDVNNLDFTVDYSAADGNIEGSEARPECARALPGGFAGFRDVDATSVLSVAVIRIAKFSAPVALAGCRIFYDTVQPVPADFRITVTNAARDGEDDNVIPKPIVQVTAVECPGELPSVTTTTVTLPDTTTTTLVTQPRCGIPVSPGAKPTTLDALFALKAAVDFGQCEPCICDIDSVGGVTASDALGILRAAVGIETPFDCPAC